MSISFYSQCINSSYYQTLTIPAPGNTTVSNCSFGGDHVILTNGVNGQRLRFSSNVTTDFLTITAGASNGPVLASGITPLIIDNTYTGNLYMHTHTNASCGTDSNCRDIVVENIAVPASHLNVDGTNDNVVIPDSPSLDFTTVYTVEAMVKLDRTIGYHQTLVSKFDDDGNNRSWMINFGEQGGGTLAVVMTPVGTWTNPLSWNTGFLPVTDTWYHVAVVFDSTLPSNQVKLYVDGALYAQTTWAFTLTPTNANVYIGGYDGFNNGYNAGANSRFLQGDIDEVRMWNVARTAEQIAGSRSCELQGNETGLVAYYKFNQGFDTANNTGITTLTDATANANNGTLTNFALNGTISNWLASSPVTTGSIIPSVPTVTTPVVYNQGATASALTATTGTNGTGLLWYTTATGGTGSATAPTPSTATLGTTSYWVSSTNANGCESARVEIVVNVNAAATHLNFDGINDYVNIPKPIALDFTIEYWVKTSASGATGPQWFNGNPIVDNETAGVTTDFGTSLNGNKLAFGIGSPDVTIFSASNINNGVWNHVAVTWKQSSGQMQLFINGVLEATGAASTAPRTASGFIKIGTSNTFASFFNGNIDELRIWNRVLTATDIQNTMNCEAQAQPELIAYYKFNQGFNNTNNTTITSLIDETGTYNGTLTNFGLTGTASNWQSGSTITTGNTCTTLSTSGFEAISSLKVYPNPSNGMFMVDSSEAVVVAIYDITGKKIIEKNISAGTNVLDISNCTSGIYILKVAGNLGNANYKIVKY